MRTFLNQIKTVNQSGLYISFFYFFAATGIAKGGQYNVCISYNIHDFKLDVNLFIIFF